MTKEEQAQRRAQWLDHIASWEKSSLTRAAYCQETGLKRNTFNDWVVRARRKGEGVAGESPALSWVPVSIQADEASPGFELRGANSWQLSLPATVSPQWVANLLRELS